MKTFLVANNKIKVVLEMFFFIFNNANIQFVEKNVISEYVISSQDLNYLGLMQNNTPMLDLFDAKCNVMITEPVNHGLHMILSRKLNL